MTDVEYDSRPSAVFLRKVRDAWDVTTLPSADGSPGASPPDCGGLGVRAGSR